MTRHLKRAYKCLIIRYFFLKLSDWEMTIGFVRSSYQHIQHKRIEFKLYNLFFRLILSLLKILLRKRHYVIYKHWGRAFLMWAQFVKTFSVHWFADCSASITHTQYLESRTLVTLYTERYNYGRISRIKLRTKLINWLQMSS